MNLNNKIDLTLPHNNSVLHFLCYYLLWFVYWFKCHRHSSVPSSCSLTHPVWQNCRSIFFNSRALCSAWIISTSSWSSSSCTLASSSVLLDRFWSTLETPASVSLSCTSCLLGSFLLSFTATNLIFVLSLICRANIFSLRFKTLHAWNCCKNHNTETNANSIACGFI